MNKAIKILEEIGQTTSLKQHENLLEMLQGLNLESESILQIQGEYKEFVCAIFPEDDEDNEEEEEKTE